MPFSRRSHSVSTTSLSSSESEDDFDFVPDYIEETSASLPYDPLSQVQGLLGKPTKHQPLAEYSQDNKEKRSKHERTGRQKCRRSPKSSQKRTSRSSSLTPEHDDAEESGEAQRRCEIQATTDAIVPLIVLSASLLFLIHEAWNGKLSKSRAVWLGLPEESGPTVTVTQQRPLATVTEYATQTATAWYTEHRLTKEWQTVTVTATARVKPTTTVMLRTITAMPEPAPDYDIILPRLLMALKRKELSVSCASEC